jgi:hypothetical protein
MPFTSACHERFGRELIYPGCPCSLSDERARRPETEVSYSASGRGLPSQSAEGVAGWTTTASPGSLRFDSARVEPSDRFEAWRQVMAPLREIIPIEGNAPGAVTVKSMVWSLNAGPADSPLRSAEVRNETQRQDVGRLAKASRPRMMYSFCPSRCTSGGIDWNSARVASSRVMEFHPSVLTGGAALGWYSIWYRIPGRSRRSRFPAVSTRNGQVA